MELQQKSLITKQEFLSRRTEMALWEKGKNIPFLALMFGGLFLCFGMVMIMKRYETEIGWVSDVATVVAFGLLIVTLFGPMTWITILRRRKFGYRCSCGMELTEGTAIPPVAVATGRCGRCGEKVFSDSEMPAPR